MKSNNFWFQCIAEKLTGRSYSDYLSNKFFLKEILKAYDVIVDRPLSFNRLLHDWYEAVTGVVVDGVFTDHYYLKRIADFLAGYDVGLRTGNFYLGLIAELIDSKESSSVSLSVSSVSPFVGDTVTLSGVLEPFGGMVKLYDGDSLLDTIETSSVDGSFSKSWTATLGLHSFKVVFEETEDYRGSESEIIDVNVVKKTTILSLSVIDSSLFVDDDLVLSGSLLWGVNPVVGASVKLYQDDVLLDTLTTDSSGEFSKTVSGLTADEYTFYAVYDGTSVYESSQSQDVSVVVSKYATSLSLNVPMNLVYSDSFNLSGVLTDENNNVLKNMSVSLLVDGVEKATTTTSNDGTASFTQTPVRTGNHTFQLSFDGNYKFEATDSSVVSRVVDKETSVLSLSAPLDNSTHYVNDDIVVVGSLLEDDGVAMKSKSIVVGDKGTVTTGDDGTFTKTISYDVKGTKTLTVSYAGDDNYTASSVTRTLILLQKTPVITISGSESEIYTNENVVISGTVKYDNTGLNNISVKIYDGNTLLDTITTNASGEFSKTVTGLVKGTHTFHAVTVETNEYESVTSSNVSVEVFNVITGISIESDKSIISGYHSENATLTATLIDSDGETVEKDGLTITFKKNDVSLGTATTSDGVATKTVTANDDGEITCKAEYSTFNDTVEIEDIYYYTDGKTDLNEWTNDSDITQTYTENGTCLFSDSTTRKFAKLNITYPSTPYIVEYKLTGITRDTTSSHATPTFMLNGVVTDETKSEGSTKIRLFQLPTDVVDSHEGAYSVGDTLRFVYDGANVTLLHNNSIVGHKSITSSYPGAQLRVFFNRGACLSDIKVDGLDINSILLASDKEVLSYVDSETATLSATVKDSNGVAINTAGVPVSFYNGATLLGTAYTNNNGIATYTYNSQGVGDVTITAKIGNITSNEITIEDCTYYTPGTTNENKWNNDQYVTMTYDATDGITATGNTTQVGKGTLNITYPTAPFSAEFTVPNYVVDGNASSRVSLYGVAFAKNTNASKIELGTHNNISQYTIPFAKGDTVKMVYDSTKVEVFINGVSAGSWNVITNWDGLCVRTYNTRSISIKNLKIKPIN